MANVTPTPGGSASEASIAVAVFTSGFRQAE
jgi:hypothetical protein